MLMFTLSCQNIDVSHDGEAVGSAAELSLHVGEVSHPQHHMLLFTLPRHLIDQASLSIKFVHFHFSEK